MKNNTIVAAPARPQDGVPEEVAVALLDLEYDLPFAREEASVLAYLLAALRSRGWTGRAADALLAHLERQPHPSVLEAARGKASSIVEPWPKLFEYAGAEARAFAVEDHLDPDEVVAEAEAHVKRLDGALTEYPPPDSVPTGGETLDLSGEPQAPPWLVRGLLLRGRTHLLSGDTGSFKSGWRSALMAAGLRGERFLGRDVLARRFLVIDGENPKDEVVAQWRALGLENHHLENVVFFGSEMGVQLGTPEWDERLRREVERFRPDVVFIDTVARTTAVAVLDNDSVTALYAKTLAPLARAYDLALVLVHHERKSGGGGDRSRAAMGARQWTAQADAHITLAPTGPYSEAPAREGGVQTRRPFAMRVPKLRGGTVDKPEHFEARGRKSAAGGALLELTVEAPRALTAAEEIVAVCDKPLGRGALAQAAGMPHDGRKFRSGLKEAIESGRLIKRDDGLYERPS